MVLSTCVKLSTVLLILKTLGELKTVKKVIQIFIVNLHLIAQFVKVLGIVKTSITSLLTLFPKPIPMMTDKLTTEMILILNI